MAELVQTEPERADDPPCRWCGKPRSEHTDKPGRLVPRWACLNLLNRYEPITEPALLGRSAS
jgi:hypothetical protein